MDRGWSRGTDANNSRPDCRPLRRDARFRTRKLSSGCSAMPVEWTDPALDELEVIRDYIAKETLANNILLEPTKGAQPVAIKIGDHEAEIYVRVVSS